MSYTPDCADCPTPEDCKAKNDCQVTRQIRHGRDLFPAEQSAATGAIFSACRQWRYLLWRTWDPTLPHAAFCLMNGSTADETDNDPTVTRGQVRARRWKDHGWLNVGGIKVVNAFGWRETDSRRLPKLVKAGVDITGPENDRYILEACKGAAIVICGWGLPGHQLLGRGPKVLAMMRAAGVVPFALHINADGSPCHPLYLSYDLKPVPMPL